MLAGGLTQQDEDDVLNELDSIMNVSTMVNECNVLSSVCLFDGGDEVGGSYKAPVPPHPGHFQTCSTTCSLHGTYSCQKGNWHFRLSSTFLFNCLIANGPPNYDEQPLSWNGLLTPGLFSTTNSEWGIWAISSCCNSKLV